MKRGLIFGVCLGLMVVFLTGCDFNITERLAGVTTVELPPDQKLQAASTKGGSIWVQHRGMRKGEGAEIYTLQEFNPLGIWQRSFIISEKKLTAKERAEAKKIVDAKRKAEAKAKAEAKKKAKAKAKAEAEAKKKARPTVEDEEKTEEVGQ